MNMKVAKKKVRMQSPLVNPIIDQERPLEKVLKNGEYIVIKCYNTPDDNDSGSYEINLPYYGGGSPKEWLIWINKFFKALDGQSISTGNLRYMFTGRLLTGDSKATFNLSCILVNIRLITSTKYFWK